jgi:hypothetical protein
MRVAWVSHQWPDADGTFVGGAEFIQHEMRLRAPDDVEVVNCGPYDVDRALGCDRIVVAGFERLTADGVSRLDGRVDVMWLMSPPLPQVHPLMLSCRNLLWASHEMRHHFGWDRGEELSGSWDGTVVPEGRVKADVAVWAARDVWHKGRDNAREWAKDRGVELLEFSGRPRAEVLDAMAGARWFVHLPNYPFDPCPTTVIEAELAGCEIVVNDLVGRVPVEGREAIVDHLEENGRRFWRLVCESV